MKKIIFHLAFFFSFSMFLSAENFFTMNERNEDDQFEYAVDSYVESLSESAFVSQLFLVNIEGNKKYAPVEHDEYGRPVVPGGVLLFSFNVAETPEEIIEFTDSIEDFCTKENVPNAYVAIDQEGGFVNRLRNITSSLPSSKKVAELYSPEKAHELYSNQAVQLACLGITMNIAPVVEPILESNEQFLGSRSFGKVPDSIVYGIECMTAYENNGVATVVKHFPGNTNTDPHVGLPKITMTDEEIARNLLIPFAFIIAKNPSCILMSHTLVEGHDENTPACLSSYWIKDILREKLKFKGLIVSDDIFMGALSDHGFPTEVAVVQTILNGTDVLMLSEKKFYSAAKTLLEESRKNPELKKRMEIAVKNVIGFKIKRGILTLEKSNGIFKVVNRSLNSGISVEQRLENFQKAKGAFK